ncbi:MAG: PD-(D/E)XK nuclease family protein [Chloroflexi bacterium]|nr:PD-(D/E)XK nuclease family protein [Chloroflexota bacterium]
MLHGLLCEPPATDFDKTRWLLSHATLVNERIRNWEVGGFEVDVEAQNRFGLRGKTATLAGRPDIISHRDDESVIVDAKTGQEGQSHAVQVMIYLYAVPKALEPYRNAKLRRRSRTATTQSA